MSDDNKDKGLNRIESSIEGLRGKILSGIAGQSVKHVTYSSDSPRDNFSQVSNDESDYSTFDRVDAIGKNILKKYGNYEPKILSRKGKRLHPREEYKIQKKSLFSSRW